MIYGRDYLREYQARAATPLGKRIYQARWDLVSQWANGGALLDYGCGSGAFHMGAPPYFQATGFDINPYCDWTGPIPMQLDVLTMWDVIEHLPDPYQPLKLGAQWVFLSTPNIDNSGDVVRDWKHFKPGEHLHYFNLKSLKAVLACAGYDYVTHNFDEGVIRDPNNPEAIISVVARRD